RRAARVSNLGDRPGLEEPTLRSQPEGDAEQAGVAAAHHRGDARALGAERGRAAPEAQVPPARLKGAGGRGVAPQGVCLTGNGRVRGRRGAKGGGACGALQPWVRRTSFGASAAAMRRPVSLLLAVPACHLALASPAAAGSAAAEPSEPGVAEKGAPVPRSSEPVWQPPLDAPLPPTEPFASGEPEPGAAPQAPEVNRISEPPQDTIASDTERPRPDYDGV